MARLVCAQRCSSSAHCFPVRCQPDLDRHSGRPGLCSVRVRPLLVYFDVCRFLGVRDRDLSFCKFSHFRGISRHFHFFHAVRNLGRSVCLVLGQLVKRMACLGSAQRRGLSFHFFAVCCQLDTNCHVFRPRSAAVCIHPLLVDFDFRCVSISVRDCFILRRIRHCRCNISASIVRADDYSSCDISTVCPTLTEPFGLSDLVLICLFFITDRILDLAKGAFSGLRQYDSLASTLRHRSPFCHALQCKDYDLAFRPNTVLTKSLLDFQRGTGLFILTCHGITGIINIFIIVRKPVFGNNELIISILKYKSFRRFDFFQIIVCICKKCPAVSICISLNCDQAILVSFKGDIISVLVLNRVFISIKQRKYCSLKRLGHVSLFILQKVYI